MTRPPPFPSFSGVHPGFWTAFGEANERTAYGGRSRALAHSNRNEREDDHARRRMTRDRKRDRKAETGGGQSHQAYFFSIFFSFDIKLRYLFFFNIYCYHYLMQCKNIWQESTLIINTYIGIRIHESVKYQVILLLNVYLNKIFFFILRKEKSDVRSFFRFVYLCHACLIFHFSLQNIIYIYYYKILCNISSCIKLFSIIARLY